jgi:hypothetical protein
VRGCECLRAFDAITVVSQQGVRKLSTLLTDSSPRWMLQDTSMAPVHPPRPKQTGRRSRRPKYKGHWTARLDRGRVAQASRRRNACRRGNDFRRRGAVRTVVDRSNRAWAAEARIGGPYLHGYIYDLEHFEHAYTQQVSNITCKLPLRVDYYHSHC